MRTEIASETRGERNRVMGCPFPLTGPTHPEPPIVLFPTASINYYQITMEPEGPIGGTVPPHVVRCLQVDGPGGVHHHVRALETVPPAGHDPQRWSLVDAIAAYRKGERFVIDAGRELIPSICPGCRLVTLNLEPGSPAADLPLCG
jgi:hypothetical protein